MDFYGIARVHLGRSSRIAKYNGRDNVMFFANFKFGLDFGKVQPWAGKADPTCAKSFVAGSEHEVLRGEAAILGSLLAVGRGEYENECRRTVEELIAWLV